MKRELLESDQFIQIFSSTLTKCKGLVQKILTSSFEDKTRVQVVKIIPIITKSSTSLLSSGTNSTNDLASNTELSKYIDTLFSEVLQKDDLEIPERPLHLQDILVGGISALSSFIPMPSDKTMPDFDIK